MGTEESPNRLQSPIRLQIPIRLQSPNRQSPQRPQRRQGCFLSLKLPNPVSALPEPSLSLQVSHSSLSESTENPDTPWLPPTKRLQTSKTHPKQPHSCCRFREMQLVL